MSEFTQATRSALQELKRAAEACPFKTWAAFTDDSGASPHTNLVSFEGRTDCVLRLPGLHKNDPLVAYLWAAQPKAILALIALAEAAPALLEALKEANSALSNVTAFEEDARYIMGNTNFAIVKSAQDNVRAALSLACGEQADAG